MCMIDYVGERSTLLSDRNHVARKNHTCSECYRKISPGESYNVQRVVFDGSAATYKTCRHCQVAKDWLTKECGGYCFTQVYDDLIEHVQEGCGLRVKMLAVGMGRKWKRKDGNMWPVPKMPRFSAI